MAVIKAIPKKLLIHKAVLHKTADEDRWGKETLDDGMEIKRIRIEPTSKVIRNKNNAEIQLAAILFYDCKNSFPQDIVFSEDDIILFENGKYAVQLIESLYDNQKLHHYEMGLVKHA